MITSRSDIDFYKFTMGEFVFKYHPDVEVEYELFDRNAGKKEFHSDTFEVRLEEYKLDAMARKHTCPTCYMCNARSFVGADGYLYKCCELSYMKEHRVRNLLTNMNFKVVVNPLSCPFT